MASVYDIHDSIGPRVGFFTKGAKGTLKGEIVDCLGFDALTFINTVEASVSGEIVTISIYESDDSTFKTSEKIDKSVILGKTKLTGTDLANSISNKTPLKFSVIGRTKRYVQLSIDFHVGVGTNLKITTLLANKREQP